MVDDNYQSLKKKYFYFEIFFSWKNLDKGTTIYRTFIFKSTFIIEYLNMLRFKIKMKMYTFIYSKIKKNNTACFLMKQKLKNCLIQIKIKNSFIFSVIYFSIFLTKIVFLRYPINMYSKNIIMTSKILLNVFNLFINVKRCIFSKSNVSILNDMENFYIRKYAVYFCYPTIISSRT